MKEKVIRLRVSEELHGWCLEKFGRGGVSDAVRGWLEGLRGGAVWSRVAEGHSLTEPVKAKVITKRLQRVEMPPCFNPEMHARGMCLCKRVGK